MSTPDTSIVIDWSPFDALPEMTCHCRCGAIYRSHAKGVRADGEIAMISRQPCPQCGSNQNLWKIASEPEIWRIATDDVGEHV